MKQGRLPPYMAYPRFLLDTDLNETVRLIYVLLLDRARLSLKNEWLDDRGSAYVFYTIRELAEDCHKSEMTVKNALAELTRQGLIRKQRRGSAANKIYVRVPGGGTENCPSDRQKIIPATDRKLSPSNKKSNMQSTKNYDCEEGESL